ncbi:MAG: amidase [Actinomycetota bacterium]|nr:amidase [Actinomycetota bacterium]
MDASLTDLDATAQAALVQRNEMHPRQLVQQAIDRIERFDPQLHVMVHRQYERALDDAEGLLPDGPFRGVPFLFKDYRCREAGEPYTMGMRALRDVGFRATTDAPLALAFRAAGLIPLGRTNTSELACVGTCEPEAFGPTHNPWATGFTPGGSSGGSAAAVAARLVPAAHATDISGSIRIPSAHCGLVGLKPSRSRVIASIAADARTGMNCEGVVTRSVRDTAGLVDAISVPGSPPLLPAVSRPCPPLRVGLCTQAFSGSSVDAENAGIAEHCATLLEGLGCSVEIAAPTPLSDPALWKAAATLLAVNLAVEVETWSAKLGRALGENDLESTTWRLVSAGRMVNGVDLLAARSLLIEHTALAESWWEDFDLLVTPTTANAPTLLGDYAKGYESGRGSAFTRPFNVTGQPAMSVPLGWPADGLPRGVQLIAAIGRDDLLITVAAALETVEPWAQRRATVSA